MSFFRFYKQLKEWEKKYGVKLKFGIDDFNIRKSKSIPPIMRKGERINAVIKAPDWYPNQMIAVAKNRCITVLNCTQNISDKVNLKIIENGNNIYLAEKV